MISFLNNVFVLFGGVYIINRLLYRFYFPKKPTFLPLQQLLLEHSFKKPSFFTRKHKGNGFFKITVNLDDHNRLINPLLSEVTNTALLGERIFKAYLNIMLPRYEKSIYVYNSHEFLSFCEKKANLYSLGKNIAFSETIELIPELVKRFNRKGPIFFQIGYSLQSVNKRKILTIMPSNLMREVEPRFCKAKTVLLHEDERSALPNNEDENQQFLHIYMDKNDVIVGRPDTSLLLFYLNEKNELSLAFLASNRAFFISCYQTSFHKMLDVMLGSSISLEKTKFIDVPTLVSLIQRGKIIEMLGILEDGLIVAISELLSYGKTYSLPFSRDVNSLYNRIFTLQKDLMVKKVHPRLFNQDVRHLWL